MFTGFDRVINRRLIANLNKWKWYPEDVLPMWVADMDFLTPEPILNALRDALDHGILGYELASRSLLEMVAGRMKKLYGWAVSPEMIVPLPNVNVGYRVAASVTCKIGEGVLVQPPVFYHFIDFPNHYGLRRQDAPLQCLDRDQVIWYELDADNFRQVIHSGGVRTSFFLLCNPHNPVGRVFTADELKWLASICEKNSITICSDDIHSELLLGNAKYIPLAALSPLIAERTITLIGPGKTFNVSGLGCAFAIIPQIELRQRFTEELERLAIEVSSLGLVAARAAYSGACDDWLSALLGYLTTNRDYLVGFIASELPQLRTTVPDATYMAWLDCKGYIQAGVITGSAQEFFLEKAKVAFYDGASFGPGGEGFVRLNFACPRSVLEEGLLRLKKALTG